MEVFFMNKFEEHEAMYDEIMKMERTIARDVKLEELKGKMQLAFDMPTWSTQEGYRLSCIEWREKNPEANELYDRILSSTIF